MRLPKFRFGIWMILCALLLATFVGCTSLDLFLLEADTGADTEADTEADVVPYTLEYTSGGDGTCTVRIVTNPDNKKPFDAVIPETSPDGETVVAVADHQFTDIVPRQAFKDDFEEKILKPMEKYYGMTLEEARTLMDNNEFENPKYPDAFYFRKRMSYFVLKDLDLCQDEQERQDMLAAYPAVKEGPIYIFEPSASIEEIIGVSTELDALIHLNPNDVTAMEEATGYSRDRLINPGHLLRSVKLPDTIKTLGEYSFAGCYLMTEIDLASVEVVKNEAFLYCSQLSTIRIPASLYEISENAYAYCNTADSSLRWSIYLDDISEWTENDWATYFQKNISDSYMPVVYLKDVPFDKVTEVVIRDGITKISGNTFDGWESLQNVTIGKDLKIIEAHAFWNCKSLTSIVLPSGLESIGTSAFSGCEGLTELVIPDSVTDIDPGAFQRCSQLTDMTIPNGVTIIRLGTFRSCTSLTNVTLPNSIVEIRPNAFEECKNLTSITYLGTVAEWEALDYQAAYKVICTDGILNESYTAPSEKESEWESEWETEP